MIKQIAVTAAAVAASIAMAPVAGADPSRTTACSFYAEDTTYIDTGVGYAKSRTAAEEYGCEPHSDGDGSEAGYSRRATERLKEFRERRESRAE